MKRMDGNASLRFEALTPGRHSFTLVVETGASESAPFEVPVHVVVGREPGPRLAVVGGVHGNEYDGIRAAQRLVQEAVPQQVAGVLVIIPVANPGAYFAGQRYTAVDGVDLNRVFPGDPGGRPTERLAAALIERVLRHMDLVFTLHGGGSESKLSWYLEFLDEDSDAGRRSYAAALASGFQRLIAIPPGSGGFMLTALGALGVPVIEGEVGGRGELHASNAAYYLARVAAVMSHMGLIDTADAAGSLVPSVWQSAEVHGWVTGMLQRHVELDVPVYEGQHLASIFDIGGKVIDKIHAPVAGRIGGFRGHSWITEGQMAFRIFSSNDPRNPDL